MPARLRGKRSRAHAASGRWDCSGSPTTTASISTSPGCQFICIECPASQPSSWRIGSGLPLFTAGLGSLFAGWATSTLTNWLGSASRARRLTGYISYGGLAAMLLAFTWIENPIFALVVMSGSSFAAELSGPISWTTAMDIGGENVGAVSGFMNTLGQLGASVAPAATGLLRQLTGNGWTLTFYASALIYAAGALCWRFIDGAQLVGPSTATSMPR